MISESEIVTERDTCASLATDPRRKALENGEEKQDLPRTSEADIVTKRIACVSCLIILRRKSSQSRLKSYPPNGH